MMYFKLYDVVTRKLICALWCAPINGYDLGEIQHPVILSPLYKGRDEDIV
jgi:hypothetical protein